ncbi:MAG: acetyl-CoA carboxylase carboxyltransferase subunit alpha [Candidatus Aminicenantes bacterium]|nr:acetyl-CoA carboxylase carboxyltransferase subunit alpha [Candidatus Aminicenantes bacterium]
MDRHKDFYQIEKNIQKHKQEIDRLEEQEQVDKERVGQLREAIAKEWEKIKPGLLPIHYVQIARHPDRPYSLDYIEALTDDFLEFHGDRRSGDDPAIVAGFGCYRGKTVAVIGHQKGRKTRERIARNFGQPNPEGFRKALRIMKLAEKFGCPVITLIDTPGAYPGLEAEERGQAEAIAFNLKEISKLKVPIINVVIGEGGSGGALGIGVGDVLLMLENSFYSVISPEGCAAILWKDQSAVQQAAENLRFLADDLMEFGVADKVIKEPPGGAHVDRMSAFRYVDMELGKKLEKFEKMSVEERLNKRYDKYRKIGVFGEEE